MTWLLSILILALCGSAFGQNVTNLVAGQRLWSGMQLTTVYDSGCPDCTNIVGNAGFDSLTPPYLPWTGSGSYNLASAYHASPPYSGRLSSGNAWASFSQTLTTESGTNYTLSFWVNDNGSPAEILAVWSGQTNLDITTYGDGAWTNLTSTVTATNASTVLQLGAKSAAYLYLDDVSVIHQ